MEKETMLREAAVKGADFQQSLMKALRMTASDSGAETVNELKIVIGMVDDSLFCLEDVLGDKPELDGCLKDGDSYVRTLIRILDEFRSCLEGEERGMLDCSLRSVEEAMEYLGLLVRDERRHPDGGSFEE